MVGKQVRNGTGNYPGSNAGDAPTPTGVAAGAPRQTFAPRLNYEPTFSDANSERAAPSRSLPFCWHQAANSLTSTSTLRASTPVFLKSAIVLLTPASHSL